MRHIAHRHLAVLRGIADVLRMRADDVGKLHLERMNDVARFVQAQRGLSQIGHAVRVRHLERLDLLGARNHLGHIRRFAQGALDLVVVAMADEHQRVALLGELHRLDVDLGHQRTGGVDHLQAAALAALADRRRNAVGRVDHALAVGHVVDFVDKDRALFRQLVDHIAVMDDLAANVDGRAEGFESDLDDVDRAHHAGAEAPWLEQQDPLLTGGSPGGVTVGDGVEDSRSHIPIITIPLFLNAAETRSGNLGSRTSGCDRFRTEGSRFLRLHIENSQFSLAMYYKTSTLFNVMKRNTDLEVHRIHLPAGRTQRRAGLPAAHRPGAGGDRRRGAAAGRPAAHGAPGRGRVGHQSQHRVRGLIARWRSAAFSTPSRGRARSSPTARLEPSQEERERLAGATGGRIRLARRDRRD